MFAVITIVYIAPEIDEDVILINFKGCNIVLLYSVRAYE